MTCQADNLHIADKMLFQFKEKENFMPRTVNIHGPDKYEGVSKSFRTGCLERILQMITALCH